LWYHVGSANERLDRTGFAHLFEHMLFQGSANVDANEHFELVQRAGGTLNGSTWLDRTNYYETVPSHQIAMALWLEADRMGRMLPALTQQKLDTQRDVVKNERRWSVDNQPYGTWWERLPALCFPETHPFHHSLIGSMEHLTDASLDDVADFFRTYYTPDNAVLTVAGDFDRAETVRLIESYYGGIPRGTARPPLRDMTLPPTFGTTRRGPRCRGAAAAVRGVSDSRLRHRRVLRGVAGVRGAGAPDGVPSGTVVGASSADRVTGGGVYLRPCQRERPADRGCHGASGGDAGGARARRAG
jgi:predicted Zn-dependent peptidase